MIPLVFLTIILSLVDATPVKEAKKVGDTIIFSNKEIILNKGTYGYTVHLIIKNSVFVGGELKISTSYCGGVIIEEDIVLTAAHCIGKDPGERTIIVWAGILDLEKQKPQIHVIKDYILHEEYADFNDLGEYHPNDIALLWVDKKFKIDNKNVKKATLAEHGFNPASLPCHVVGWGHTECAELSTRLREALLKIVLQQDCEKYFSININKKVVCAISDDLRSGINFGDSGGPLIIGDKVVGITSFAGVKNDTTSDGKLFETCDTKVPAVFTEVSKYRGWISLTTLSLKLK